MRTGDARGFEVRTGDAREAAGVGIVDAMLFLFVADTGSMPDRPPFDL